MSIKTTLNPVLLHHQLGALSWSSGYGWWNPTEKLRWYGPPPWCISKLLHMPLSFKTWRWKKLDLDGKWDCGWEDPRRQGAPIEIPWIILFIRSKNHPSPASDCVDCYCLPPWSFWALRPEKSLVGRPTVNCLGQEDAESSVPFASWHRNLWS